MSGKTLWNAKVGRMIQENKPDGRDQAAWRSLMAAGAIVGATLTIGVMVVPLNAQSYPNKPIRLIVPFTPGGTASAAGRIVAQKLNEQLGQPVVVENRGGAGGNIGHELAAQAKPDGYTILVPSSSLACAGSLYKNLKFDPSKDFVPISPAGQAPIVVVVRSSLPVKNLKELVDYAKANPGKLNYASSGHGTTTQLASELLLDLAKIKMVHVAYKSAGDVMIALLTNDADVGLVSPPTALPHLQGGKVRVLAVLRDGNKRLPSMPSVPTTQEAGIDNCEVTVWYGIFAPAGTPRDIINRLNTEWTKGAKTPETIDMMNKIGLEPLTSTPEEFSKFFKAEIVRWAKVIKDAKLSLK